MRTCSPPDMTFSLSSGNSPRSSAGSLSPACKRRADRPPQIKLPEPKENDQCYGVVLQGISASSRTAITRDLVRPVAIVVREGIDPEESSEVFAEMENTFFHPDSGDDTLFQIVIDYSCTVCPATTIYIIPEKFLPFLVDILTAKKLLLINGAPIVVRDRRIDTYDPSPQIERELGLNIERRLFIIDRPFSEPFPIPICAIPECVISGRNPAQPYCRIRRPSAHTPAGRSRRASLFDRITRRSAF